jgi:hypothetical protein
LQRNELPGYHAARRKLPPTGIAYEAFISGAFDADNHLHYWTVMLNQPTNAYLGKEQLK